LIIVEKDNKFLLSGLSAETPAHLSIEELDDFIYSRQGKLPSKSVQSKLQAASDFLHSGGEQVILTTLRKLPETLADQSGLRIGSRNSFAAILASS
jgi:carbamate kinase